MECSPIRLQVGVFFSTKIDQSMFNWTSNGQMDKFTFRPSLAGYPDLPSFLRYMYSEDRRVGYLYGAPTEQFANRELEIEVVARNSAFETRQVLLKLKVEKARKLVNNVLQMKIDNQDWVNFMMDPGRIEDLKNIFRKELWPESGQDLNVVFLDAAVNMGARFPASPQLKEGVVVQLGSRVGFSDRLKELQEEVKPLYKMSRWVLRNREFRGFLILIGNFFFSCKFKRTSVQAIFENQGFKLDWCAFKLIEMGDGNSSQSEAKRLKGDLPRNAPGLWHGLRFEDIPVRNYIDEVAFTVAIPGMIFAVLLAVLTGILCFQHESL